MKKILFPRLSLLLLTALAWISCSKEKLSSQENESDSPVTVEKSPFGNPFTQRTGIIKGAITPAGTKAIIVAYNDSYRSAEQVADIISGKFKVTELPEGFYTLSVKYAFNDANGDTYSYIEIPDIKVAAGEVADAGTIILR